MPGTVPGDAFGALIKIDNVSILTEHAKCSVERGAMKKNKREKNRKVENFISSSFLLGSDFSTITQSGVTTVLHHICPP